jgi:hypothetical protein
MAMTSPTASRAAEVIEQAIQSTALLKQLDKVEADVDFGTA